jgi:long-chain fatty acid transport protein
LQSQNGQEISATLPGSYTLALGYKPSDKWNVEFDVIHTRWESVKEIKYGGAYDSATELYYKNTWRFQVGGEYWFTDWLAGRLGYSYDQTPTRAGYASYMLPANDRMLYSTGLGFKWDKMTADVSFMYVTTKERTGMTIGSNPVNFSDGKTWITGLSLGYEF